MTLNRIRRLIIISVVLISPFILLSLVLTQPVFESFKGTYQQKARPDYLRLVVVHLSENLPHRSFGSGGLYEAANYIETEFKKYTHRVKRQSFEVTQVEHQNVIAQFGPDDESLPLIVVGAHYDSWNSLPGADDNASGVATLLELARLLSLSGEPALPIELVAYTLEEPPNFGQESMGSHVHSHRLFDTDRQVELMIAIEMVGYYSDEPGSQDYPLPLLELLYPSQGNYLALVGRLQDWQMVREMKALMINETPLPVHSLIGLAHMPELDYSDHRNYWAYDFPAIMATDTAFYRNKAYHTKQDTWQRLDYEKMAMVVEGLHRVVSELAIATE